MRTSDFPYPGLRPFDRHETDIFFGREEHTDQLIDQLRKGDEADARFLAVVGRSGSGKSSLVHTGLLAGLETGFLAKAGVHWRIAKLRPGNHPFDKLAEALLADIALKKEYLSRLPEQTESAEATAFLKASLRRGSLGIYDVLQDTSLPEHTNLLILVDQFEELFRHFSYHAGKQEEVAAFVALLLEGCKHPNVYVVITMRSDFMGDCTQFYGLPEAINRGLFLTPRLTREQLRAAIEGPARVFDDDVEPALVNRLLNDMGDDPDQLPLMQHALMLMWRQARTEMPEKAILDLKHYQKIGRLGMALSQHADQVFTDRLDRQQQGIAKILFCSMSEGERSTNHLDRRRPVILADVAKLAGVSWEQVAEVAEVFRRAGRNFITPLPLPSGQELTPESVLDVSHESLIHHWQQLKNWVRQEEKSAEIYQNIVTTARNWEEIEEGEKYEALWYRLALESALEWIEREKPTATWAKRYDHDEDQNFDLCMEFLEEGKRKKEKEHQLAEEQQKNEVERVRKTRAWILIGFLIATLLAVWGIKERNHAKELEQLARISERRALASEQQALASEQQARKAQLQAEQANQSRALSFFNSQLSQAKWWMRDEDYAAAKQILSGSRQLNPEISLPHQHARDLLERFSEIMGETSRHEYKTTKKELYTIAISPGGRLLAAGGENGVLMLFSVDDKERLQHRLKGHTAHIKATVFHPERKWLASAGDDGLIIFWSLPGGKEKTIKKEREWKAPGQVWTMAVNPEGSYLASGGDDNNVTLRETETGKVLRILKGHEDGVSKLAFSPIGNLLASASYDDTARVWDVKTGEQLHILTRHTDNIGNIIFSPDGTRIATGGRDGSIRLWDTKSGEMLRVLEAPVRSAVLGLEFIANGRYLISGGTDRKLHFWDIETGVILRVLQDHKASVNAITAYAGELFSTGNDGMVLGWNTNLPYLEMDLPGEPASTAVAPDGDSVAVGFADGILHLYSLTDSSLLWEQKAHESDIQRLDFNADGSLLASAGLDSTAKLWQIKPGEPPEQQASIQHTNDVSSVAFSADGRTLATSSYDGKVGLFTIGAKQAVFVEGHQRKEINSVAFPSNTQLLSAGDNGVRLWDLKKNPPALLQTFSHIQESVLWAAASPDGKRFATVGRKPVITVYSLPDGAEQHRLTGHNNTILRAEFSPDSHQLATVSGDASVRFWDLNNGTELFSLRLPALPNPPAPLWDFDFRCTPKGCWVAVPLTRGKLVLYDLGRIYGDDDR